MARVHRPGYRDPIRRTLCGASIDDIQLHQELIRSQILSDDPERVTCRRCQKMQEPHP